MKQPIKLAIVDDHILLREGLVTTLNNFDEFFVVASLNDGSELTDEIMKKAPDIIILDVSMPKKDGYATSDWLRKNYPDVKILILTMYDSEVLLIRLLQKGVKGFVKKDIPPKEFRNALITLAENGYYYSHDATAKLATLFHTDNLNGSLDRAILNETEITFITLASSEMTYKEIAEKMNVSPRAIDAYRDNLFSKLNLKSRVSLVMFSMRNGIVTI